MDVAAHVEPAHSCTDIVVQRSCDPAVHRASGAVYHSTYPSAPSHGIKQCQTRSHGANIKSTRSSSRLKVFPGSVYHPRRKKRPRNPHLDLKPHTILLINSRNRPPNRCGQIGVPNQRISATMRAPGSHLAGVHPLHTFASRPTTGRLRGRGNKQDKRVHGYDRPGAAAFS